METQVQVRPATVPAVLDDGPDEPYHLVLLDPPYDLGEEDLGEVLGLLVSAGWLDPDYRNPGLPGPAHTPLPRRRESPPRVHAWKSEGTPYAGSPSRPGP